MKAKEKKSFRYYMRALHRDIGFFMIGLIVVYSISGITLIYRDTGFLKHETRKEVKLQPGIDAKGLGNALHMRFFEVVKEEGGIIYFQGGTYDQATGIAIYTEKELPAWLSKLDNLHKISSQSIAHWFSALFGILLLFLALSSFWMFKPASKLFRRGIWFAGTGILLAVVLVLL